MANSNERCYSIPFVEAVQSSKNIFSCLFIVPVKERLILKPYYLGENGSVDEKAVAKDLLTPLLFVYSKKLDGIPISHGKIKFSKDGRIQESTGYIIAFVTYVMVVFRPKPMAILTGTVNKILPEGNCIGLLAHNFFNISCILPNNQKVEIGEEKQLQITSLVSHKKSLQIKAKLLQSEENSCIITNIKQETPSESDEVSEPLNGVNSIEQTTPNNSELTKKKRKRKSHDADESEVTSEKKSKKKKIKVKMEAENS